MATPISVSRSGGGVLKNVTVGLASLPTGDYLTTPPTITTDATGVTFANVRVNTTSVTIDGTVYAAGKAFIFDVVVSSTAKLGTSNLNYRYTTFGGEALAWTMTLVVVERFSM